MKKTTAGAALAAAILFLMSGFALPGQANKELEGVWDLDAPGAYVTLTLKGGAYELDTDDDGNPEVKGDYTVDGDKIRIRDKEGALACPQAAEGVYRFVFGNNTMTLIRVSDECPSRGGDSEETSWRKRK